MGRHGTTLGIECYNRSLRRIRSSYSRIYILADTITGRRVNTAAPFYYTSKRMAHMLQFFLRIRTLPTDYLLAADLVPSCIESFASSKRDRLLPYCHIRCPCLVPWLRLGNASRVVESLSLICRDNGLYRRWVVDHHLSGDI